MPEARAPEKREGSGIDYGRNIYDPSIQSKLAAIVILDTGDGEVVLNKGNISKVEFPKGFSASYLSKEKAKRIKFKVAGSRRKPDSGCPIFKKALAGFPVI